MFLLAQTLKTCKLSLSLVFDYVVMILPVCVCMCACVLFKRVYDTWKDADVFVYFFAPWCGHCKSMEPNLLEVAEHFNGPDGTKKTDPPVIFARIDGSRNEVLAEGVRVFGFPTMYLFPRDDKFRPREYDGPTGVSDVVDFIEQFRAQRAMEQNEKSLVVE